MEGISATDQDSLVHGPNTTSTPLTLQSLCIKIIQIQENYCNKVEKTFYDEIDEEKKPTSTISSNLDVHSLCQNLYSTEMDNCESYTENLNLLDINAEEWINTKEFDSIIHELRNADPFPNLKNDVGHLSRTQIYHTKIRGKTFEEEYINYTCLRQELVGKLDDKRVETNNYLEDNLKAEPGDKDLIIISSSDDSDFEFSFPNDIDTISLSSIEYYENNIRNDEKSKVTLEISPQMQYITNLNEPTDTKDTKQELGTISLSSSCISLKTDKDFVSLTNSSIIKQDLDDSFCSGYNSSDFEFITEEEAIRDGLIINYKNTKEILKNENCVTVEVSACNANTSQRQLPSIRNNSDYRNNHRIPEGENYSDLFSGIYAPTTPWMFENKSMGSLMNTEYAGLGFDIGALSRRIREYQPDDEYQEEAEDCAMKILNMYPRENRKRRRRFY